MTPEETTALQEENAKLKTDLAALQCKLDELNKKDAEAVVAKAAAEGRIGTDPALQAKWVDSLLKDAGAKDLLLAMAPNKALTEKITDSGKTAETKETPHALLAKFHELPREEQPAFFAKHRNELIAARDASLRN
jgi:hypothetical protein